MQSAVARDIDEYIAGFPKQIQKLLNQVRATVRKVVPEAEETIKYGMPTYVFHGNLVYFAAFKKHIGFYPVPSGNTSLKKELSGYKMGKGSIQFPFDKPLPLDLIRRLTELRVVENLERR